VKSSIFLISILLWSGTAEAENLVTEAAIHQSVSNFVHDALVDHVDSEERFEVQVRWQGDLVLEQSGEVEIAVKRLSSRAFRGPTIVRVELIVDERTERAMTVTADTRFFREVLVSTRNVRRGEVLQAEMFELEECDITKQNEGYFFDFADLEGARAKRSIGANRVVTQRHVEPVPVILRGEEVTLILETDNVRLSIKGKALQDGGIGQQIRVRNGDSRKVLQGEVIDAQTVRMTF